jgi:hypothetical protein
MATAKTRVWVRIVRPAPNERGGNERAAPAATAAQGGRSAADAPGPTQAEPSPR